jgi:UDP-GlcNAc3NAcA epimerase
MVKILTVIGARPQFIKAAPVSHALAEQSGIQEIILHTGQHFDHHMSQVFFDQMKIPRPAYNLDIHSMDHGAMTGNMLIGIEKAIQQENPDWVMVYGDTNSTLAGALAAVKQGVGVVHVEAGLRSFNMEMPEEINRILTDRISSLLFCPTITAVENLSREGFDHFPCQIMLTGDVMYDACLRFQSMASRPQGAEIPDRFLLATIHRAENTNDPIRMNKIIWAMNKLSDIIPVVFPVHPRTRSLLKSGSLPELSRQIILCEPVGYLEMLYLLKKCQMVITDSGGLQKEAYFFEKPCMTVREETEWTELVRAGYNKVCGTRPENILLAFTEFLETPPVFENGLYGKGNAAEKIAAAFLDASA